MLPHVDQTKMYTSVYERLKEGGSVGIFPVSLLIADYHLREN